MKIAFAEHVVCQGGELAGEVTGVVIDTQSSEITHIVLGNSSLVATDWLVPLSQVQGTTQDGLVLHAKAEQLTELPQFVPGLETKQGELSRALGDVTTRDNTALTPTRAIQVHKSVTLVRAGSTVSGLDGRIGTLAAVLADVYDNHLSSILIASGSAAGTLTSIPAKWIQDIRAESIKLAATTQQARGFLGPEAGSYVSEQKRTGGIDLGPPVEESRPRTPDNERSNIDLPFFGGEL